VALVWYRDAKIVRVAIAPNDGEKPQIYADYCYRQDGTLARLRSMPRVQRSCEQNRYQCGLVLRQERWYLPEEAVLKTIPWRASSLGPPWEGHVPVVIDHRVV
jgi:hypothetical protein